MVDQYDCINEDDNVERGNHVNVVGDILLALSLILVYLVRITYN